MHIIEVEGERSRFDSFEELQVYVNDPSKYKKYYMTAYNMTATWGDLKKSVERKCMVNYLVRGSDTYLTTYMSDEAPIILSGRFKGQECMAISLDTLCNRFTLGNGKPITKKYVYNCVAVDANKECQLSVKCRPSAAFYAICVPTWYRCELKVGGRLLQVNVDDSISKHARGDFIICPSNDNDSEPDLSQAFVMFGDLFAVLFSKSLNGERLYNSEEVRKAGYYYTRKSDKFVEGITEFPTLDANYKLHSLIVSLFNTVVSVQNMNRLLQQVHRLPEWQATCLLEGLESLMNSLGSLSHAQGTIALWAWYKQRLTSKLLETLQNEGIRYCLREDGMLGCLELTTDEFGSLTLGFTKCIYDNDEFKSRYIFKYVDVIASVAMRGEAGSYADVIPLTRLASLLLEKVDYPGYREDYSFCIMNVVSILEEAGWSVVRAKKAVAYPDALLKMEQTWRALLNFVPFRRHIPLQIYGYLELLDAIVSVPDCEEIKKKAEKKRKAKTKSAQTSPDVKVQPKYPDIQVPWRRTAPSTKRVGRKSKPKPVKKRKNTKPVEVPAVKIHRKFVDSVRSAVTDSSYTQENINNMLRDNAVLMLCIRGLLMQNVGSSWQIGVKPVVKGVKEDNMFNADYMVKCGNTWYFILYSRSNDVAYWYSKVALMSYDETHDILTGRRGVLELGDQPWKHTWIELGNMVYGETPQFLGKSVEDIRKFLL